MAKKEVEKILTPKGVAQYPWLKNPDTQFNPEGEYKVNLIIPAKEAKDLMAVIDGKVKAIFDKTVKEAKPQVKKSITSHTPYEDEYTDDGEKTGNVIFKFKQKARITMKDGTVIEKKIFVFDAKRQPVDPVPGIFGGSILKVNFTPIEYYNQATKQAGVSLRLNAVQIIELVTGGGATAAAFDFEDEEGFDASDLEETSELDEATAESAEDVDF